MLASMYRRGPDRQRGWRGGGAALGQVLLTTTPEAACEAQPWIDPETGCVVVSDSRLDNRDELARTLRLPAANLDLVGDAELLLAAWQKWGEGCAERLLGDFVFAIWDRRSRTLFCARDVMGVRPLYYHHTPDKRFVLASETTAVLTQPVPAELNEGRIADAIVRELEGIDKTSTFFQSVVRLPPAHWLLLKNGELRIHEYWDPLVEEPGNVPATDDEWVDALRSTLQEAVRCRLRSSGRVGSMLSGGVDSSAIVALADETVKASGRGLLPTFSAINSDGQCAETAGIRAMLSARTLDATLIDVQSEAFVQAAACARMQSLAEPFDGTMTLIDCVYRSAAEHGVRSVMDGMPADNLYTTAGHAQRLLDAGRFIDGYQEAMDTHRDIGTRYPWFRAGLTVAAHFAPSVVRRARRRYVDHASFQRRLIDSTLIARVYAQDVGLWNRFLSYRDDMNRHVRVDSTARALTTMSVSYVTAGVERYGRVAASYGVEARHPFLDKRIIQLHAWVPIHLRRRDSREKWLLRRAIEPLVPAETARAARRAHLGWRFNMIGATWWRTGQVETALRHRLDVEKMHQFIERFGRSGSLDDFGPLHSAMLASAWLRQHHQRVSYAPVDAPPH